MYPAPRGAPAATDGDARRQCHTPSMRRLPFFTRFGPLLRQGDRRRGQLVAATRGSSPHCSGEDRVLVLAQRSSPGQCSRPQPAPDAGPEASHCDPGTGPGQRPAQAQHTHSNRRTLAPRGQPARAQAADRRRHLEKRMEILANKRHLQTLAPRHHERHRRPSTRIPAMVKPVYQKLTVRRRTTQVIPTQLSCEQI